MDISGTKNNTEKLNKATRRTETIKMINQNKINQSIKMNKTNNRVNECILEVSPLTKIDIQDPHISNISKSICKLKIVIQKQNQLQTIKGTGFLLKIYIDQECFYCLMSNEHVITNDIIYDNNNIYIYYDNELKLANIQLNDNKKRYIKSFKDKDLDISVIEILDEDNISKDYFLYPESNIIINILFY